MEKEEKKPMTVAEAGRRGGLKTSERHGEDFYKAIGAKGGNLVKERYGSEYYSEMGKKGAAARHK